MVRNMISRLLPASMAGRMIGVLALSFAALLAVLTIVEQRRSGDIYLAASDPEAASRIQRMAAVLSRLRTGELTDHARAESLCHVGYEVSGTPYPGARRTPRTDTVERRLAEQIQVPADRIRVGLATLTAERFGYARCPPGQMDFPVDGLVISLRLAGGQWLHAEIHPHEPHFRMTLQDWFERSALAFILVAGIAALFLYRLAKPLRALGEGAERFGAGLKVEPIAVAGPPDMRRVISAFNAMQQQVTDAVSHWSMTLAALSHDLRTPLTALRVKVEMIDDEKVRTDLIASIDKMEAVATSTIEFLDGESRSEPLRDIDLAALVESECADFEDIGAAVVYSGSGPVRCRCRPEALSRAVRNLIDNALKYAGGALVTINADDSMARISVADNGPGIAPEMLDRAVQPFVRLPEARANGTVGSGLGLAVVKAVAEGHKGDLKLEASAPRGLVATIAFPIHL